MVVKLKKFRHKKTGEIRTQIPVIGITQWEEIKPKKKNWLVRVYSRGKPVDKWILTDKTEIEALDETETEIAKESRLQELPFDFTIVPTKLKKLKDVI